MPRIGFLGNSLDGFKVFWKPHLKCLLKKPYVKCCANLC
jgi:hypothetical protein